MSLEVLKFILGTTKAYALGKELQFAGESGDGIVAADVSVSAAVASLLGLSSAQRNVEAALQSIAMTQGGYDGFLVEVHLTDYLGVSYSGIELEGVTNIHGGPAITDDNGICLCLTTENQVTITASSSWDDLQDATATVYTSATVATVVNLVYNKQSDSIVYIKQNGSVVFSNCVASIDCTCVGGGGGGGSAYYNKPNSGMKYADPGAGGNGGGTRTVNNIVVVANTPYSIIIGHGGSGAIAERYANGGTGGTTTANFPTVVSAPGGQGGAAQDGPKTGSNNQSGNGLAVDGKRYGGGGGCPPARNVSWGEDSGYSYPETCPGGSPYGSTTVASANTGGGGGGGYGVPSRNSYGAHYYAGYAGGSGICIIKINYK